MIKDLSQYDYIALDVETRGLEWYRPEHGIFGIAITTCEDESIYFDIRREPEKLAWLRKQKPNKIVNHNIKFDLHMLWSLGIEWEPEICECTMIRANLINEHLHSYSLDNLANKYLNASKQNDIYPKLAELFGGNPTRAAQIKNLYKAPAELVSEYAKVDTELAIALWRWQEDEISKQKLERVWKLEFELFPVVFSMERHGVRIDVPLAEATVSKVEVVVDKSQRELDALAGFKCNPNPSGDIHKALVRGQDAEGNWFSIAGTFLAKTKTGKPQLDKKALEDMHHPIADAVLKTRRYKTALNTFLKGHILGHEYNGRLHPNINQVKGENGGTKTGRFSMTQPALQQIPARDKEIAALIRPIFLPDEGYLWGCWDYSQFEYRMFSQYVNDPEILEIYRKDPNFDYHQMVADLTGLPRNAPAAGGANAKQLNLSMIYDMGDASVARSLGLPVDPTVRHFTDRNNVLISYQDAGPEAKAVIEKYHAAIPGVRDLAKDVKAKCKSKGFILSICERKMRYPRGQGISKAKANMCQGSSADCMKQKMIELHRYFKVYEPLCYMYLTVHDEINIGIPKDSKNLLSILRNIRKILETYDGVQCPIRLTVPIKTDFGIGYNWARASGKGV